jgi:hypothetical protein
VTIEPFSCISFVKDGFITYFRYGIHLREYPHFANEGKAQGIRKILKLVLQLGLEPRFLFF